MKYLPILFSIYLLVLSCIFCTDKDGCDINTGSDINIVASDDHHGLPGNEACTPFCHCIHCSITAFHHLQITDNPVKGFITDITYPAYHFSYTSQILFAIWQPPQLG